jgi:hypothetical protein
VAQAMVPEVVMVPPVMGAVVAMLVTLPLPAGVAQIPSPRQNVDDEAKVPLFRCDTAKFPVTPPLVADAKLMIGMSALTSARNVGATAAPVVGPANTKFADCVDSVNVNAGVDVAVATEVVNSGVRLPALNEVTVPPPPPPPGPIKAQVLVPLQYLNCCVEMSQMVGS